MTWATSVPILVFLGISVLEQTSDVRQKHRLMHPPRGGGIIKHEELNKEQYCTTITHYSY